MATRSVLTKQIINIEIAPNKTYNILNVSGDSCHFNEVLISINSATLTVIAVFAHTDSAIS